MHLVRPVAGRGRNPVQVAAFAFLRDLQRKSAPRQNAVGNAGLRRRGQTALRRQCDKPLPGLILISSGRITPICRLFVIHIDDLEVALIDLKVSPSRAQCALPGSHERLRPGGGRVFFFPESLFRIAAGLVALCGCRHGNRFTASPAPQESQRRHAHKASQSQRENNKSHPVLIMIARSEIFRARRAFLFPHHPYYGPERAGGQEGAGRANMAWPTARKKEPPARTPTAPVTCVGIKRHVTIHVKENNLCALVHFIIRKNNPVKLFYFFLHINAFFISFFYWTFVPKKFIENAKLYFWSEYEV